MKGLPVFFTGIAEEDLDQIEDYISAHDPAAAARVRTAIVRNSICLGNTPQKGMALKEPQGAHETAVRLWPVSRYRNYFHGDGSGSAQRVLASSLMRPASCSFRPDYGKRIGFSTKLGDCTFNRKWQIAQGSIIANTPPIVFVCESQGCNTRGS